MNKSGFLTLIICTTALCMAWGLKYHYSTARAENLKWILAPTTVLVEIISGHRFYFESDTGYMNQELKIIIAPACAGVNFLIAAFGMSFFCGIFRFSGRQAKFFWLAGCAAGALIVAIIVNAVRIRISIAMITADIHAGWFTPQRLHHLSGILIYFFFLSLFYHIIQKIIFYIHSGTATHYNRRPKNRIKKKRFGRNIRIGILPLAFYWLITMGIPALNAAFKKDPAGFIEHCGLVMAGSISIFLLLHFVKPGLRIFAGPLINVCRRLFQQPATELENR